MKKLIGNFFYSIGMHVIKIIMPLLLFPIIARCLGSEGLGLFSFYQAITIIVSSVVEYGYAYSAVNKLVKNDNVNKQSIIEEVEVSRLLLSLVLIFSSILTSIYEMDFLIVIAVLTGVLTGSLPIYIYQAHERFKELAIIEFFSLCIYYLLSFFLLYVFTKVWCVIFSLMISRVFVFGVLRAKENITYTSINLLNFNIGILSLKHNFIYFLHRASIVIYSTFTVMIIKLLYDDYILGFYSSAEKIVVALCGIAGPIQSVLLPYLSKNDRGKIIPFFYVTVCTGAFIFAFITSYYANDIFITYYGERLSQGSIYYNFLIWLFPLKIISSLLSTDLFLSKGMQKHFSSTYLRVIFFMLPVIFFSIYFYGINMMMLALIFSELVFILALITKYLQCKRCLINDKK